MQLELVFAGIYVWAVLNAVWHGNRIKDFLAATTSISDQLTLERFKGVARENMYMALLQMVLLLAGVVVGLVILMRHGAIGLLAVLLVNAVVFGLGKHYGKLEKRIRELPADSEELGREHRRISEVWVKKALPDF